MPRLLGGVAAYAQGVDGMLHVGDTVGQPGRRLALRVAQKQLDLGEAVDDLGQTLAAVPTVRRGIGSGVRALLRLVGRRAFRRLVRRAVAHQ